MQNSTGGRALLFYFAPGLFVCLGMTVWGFTHRPAESRHEIPEWIGQWSEPGQPRGVFKSWRRLDDAYLGETEIWPHLRPRANSLLLSDVVIAGDVTVSMRVRFLRGRYLGCYLGFDPVKENGFWLATGHDVGEDPNFAYIKKVQGPNDFEVMQDAPLEIVRGREYELVFQMGENSLTILVDGAKVVTWEIPPADRKEAGNVLLRLHNTKAVIRDLRIETKTKQRGTT